MRRISRSEEYNLGIMEERRDGSAVLESDIGRKPDATDYQNLQPDSGSAPVLESRGSGDQRTEASDLQKVEDSVMNANPVCPLDELPASQGAKGDTSCPARGDPVFRQENIYGSVLHQMLQQQKHKHGRRFKKKTLVKMATLLVTAKGWDHRENQSLTLQEELDLKEEISVSIQGKNVPGNPDTSGNLSGEIGSESNREETKVPSGRLRKKATEAPKAAGGKTDETPAGSGSDFILKNKEEETKTDKDPELKFRKEAIRKRIREPEGLSVSPGGKQKRKMDPVARIQITPAAFEADGGLSGFARNTAAQETEPQESKRKSRKSRNPPAEQLPAGGDPPLEENRTKPEEEASSLDVFPKLQLGKRGAKTNKISIWEQLPSAEMSNIQNETGEKHTKTVPAEEETMDWNERPGTISQKPDEDPIRSWKKSKGRGQRKKIQQQTFNLQSKTQPVWEAPTSNANWHCKSMEGFAGIANPFTENQEFPNWDELDEGWKFGKIRRSCTLGTKTSSAADEWLIRYLKGSRRKDSCKASNILELKGKDEPTSENGTKFKQTKRGRKKSTGPSTNGETVPGNVNQKGKEAKQELAVELNKDRLGFPILPASNSAANRREEERKNTVSRKTGPKRRRVPNKDIKTGPKILESQVKHPNEGDPGNPEDGNPSSVRRARRKNVFMTKEEEHEMEISQLMSSFQDKSNTTETRVTPETKGKTNLLQIEATSHLKDDSLEVESKTAPRKMKRGPKKRRILKKRPIKPKILKSDEKHPGTPEDGKTSIQDGSGETAATPETNVMSSFQPEGAAGLKDGSLEATAVRRKTGPQKRQIVKKNSIAKPEILKSDEKHPDEGDPGSPEDGKPSSGLRRGRSKNVLPIKIQDEISNVVEILKANKETEKEKSQMMTSELREPNQIHLLPIEGMSDPKDDSLETKTKTASRKVKMGPKTRQMLRKRSTTGTKVLESEEKQPQQGAPHDGKLSIQDERSLMHSRGKTGVTPNRINLLQIKEKSDLKADSLDGKSKTSPRKTKTRPKKRRTLRKRSVTPTKMLDSDGKDPDEGNAKDGKPSRRKNVLPVKMEDEASSLMGTEESGKEKSQMTSTFQVKSNATETGSETRVTPEIQGKTNLLQTEGTSGLNDDSLNVKSKMAPRKMRKGQKKRRILRKRSTTRANILDSDEKPEQDYPGATEDENSPEGSGGHTGATPEPDRIEGTCDLKEDFMGVKTAGRKSGPKRKRVQNKNLTAGLKILESEEKHPDPGSPEDGKPLSVRRGRKINDFAIKLEEEPIFIEMEANKDSEMEKSQLVSSFHDKRNTAESGSETRATPEIRGKVNLLQIEGMPTDPKDDSGAVSSKVQGQKQSFDKDSARPNIQESDDHLCERDAEASEDGRMSKTSNMEHRRKTTVFTIKLEDGASCFMETGANEEPETEKLFQESASSTAPRKTRQKRRRRRTHWSGHRKAKRSQVCSSWDVPAVPSSCDQTFIQKQNQEHQMTTNTQISHHFQKKKKDLQCSFCLRSFRHISALTLHKRVHTGRKPYGCPVCAKSFSMLPDLKLHSKLHRGPAAARCPICEETLRDKTKLIRHLKVHLAEGEGLQTKPGKSRLSRFAPGQEETFRCSVCSREFTKKSAFENHQQIHDRNACRKPRRIHGFHVSEAGDTTIVTPVFFKCPICRQIHRRWCHYVLHLHSHAMGKPHRCSACRQEYSRAARSRRHCSVCCRVSGEEAACRGSLEDMWEETGESASPRTASEIPEEERNGKTDIPPPSSGGSSPSVIEDFDVDVSSLNFGFSKPTFSPEPPRLSLQSWCGRFRNKRQAFRCSRCELEFHFLGSYMDHLQEHVPKSQNACLSCNKPQLEPRGRQPNGLKCSTCGKLFSSPRNLRKHKLLHKAAHSHICLPCGRSFPSLSALEAHLGTHRRRLRVPRPARVEEPFLFPYPCRKCSSRFSSTDLLEAHQVCHSFAGRRPESPPESILSFIPNPQTVAVSSPGPKRWLQVSNRKDLFSYPHPDHLYVVPAVIPEMPAVIPETPAVIPEMPAVIPETPAVIPETLAVIPETPAVIPETLAVIPETPAVIPETPAVIPETPAVIPETPAVIPETTVFGLDLESGANPTSAELQLQLLVKSLVPEKRSTASDSSDSEDEPTLRRQNCAICMQTFADVTTLHEHYRNHARGM